MPSYYGITQKFNEGDENLYYAQLTSAISAALSIRIALSGKLLANITTLAFAKGTVQYATNASPGIDASTDTLTSVGIATSAVGTVV